MAFTQDFFTSRRNKDDGETRIGEKDRLWYSGSDNTIRIGDGETPGGVVVGGGAGGGNYTLPTATTTVKGGVKIDGNTITISNQVISVGTVPYANLSGAPTAVSEFTNDSGYLTDGDFDLSTIDFDADNKLHATGVLPGDEEGFTAVFAGRAAGIAALPNTVIQSQAQVNDYAQNNFQNTFDGNHASTEWVATSPNGDDSNYYIDVGINGASWDGTASNSLYTNAGQRDGWVYVQGGNAGGGNLILGTSLSNTYTKIISGDASVGDTEVARFSSTEVKLSKQLTFDDNTTQTTAWTGTVDWSDVTNTPTILTTLDSLDDVTTTGATDGQVLKYNASLAIWQPAADLVGSGGSGIGLSDLSASNASASGGGSLSYNNTSGVFTFTPPDLSSYVTSSSLSSTLSTYATQTYVTTRGYITGDGNAATATKLGTARTINNVSFDGTSNITITAVNPNALTIGSGLSGTSYTGSSAVTIAIDNTVATLTGSQTLLNKNINGSNNTITNIANSSLTNSSITVGTTAISLGSSSTTLAGMAWITFAGSTSGTTQLRPSAIAGNTTVTMPGTTGTLITTGDTGTVTNTMLAGSIANNKLTNSSITVNGTSISLGSSATITVNSISASGFTSSLGFDAGGSLILSNTTTFRSPTGLTIQTGGPSFKNWAFDTSGSITFPDSTVQSTAYTGNAATVTNGVYTTDTGTVTNTMLAGSIANNKLTNSSVTVGTTAISLGSSSTTLAGLTSVDSAITGTNTLFTSATSRIDAFISVGILNLGNNTGTGSNTTNLANAAQASGTTKTVNVGTNSAAGSTTNVNIGSTAGTSTTTVNGSLVYGPAQATGILNLSYSGVGTTGTIYVSGQNRKSGVTGYHDFLQVTNEYGSATNPNKFFRVSGTGTLEIMNSEYSSTIFSLSNAGDLTVGGSISTTSSITSNNATAFIAGANAVSNVSLQMPSESALRNLTNGSTNMYFDVSIGGSSHGQFQFRSSSSYTNVLTMSPTGVTFNTDATFTSRTPSLARTAFNSAIDTEITIDSMRFRISNQGGIFPQVIGNGSSRNLAWTSVGAISGSAINQAGSVGTIVASNAWTTLYNLHGMDNAGDTVTVTLQDKAAGRIYRITFMRSDNGTTTGYNIIGERLL